MASVVADQNFTKLVFRAEPFIRMDSALRYEMLSLSRPAQFSDGDYFFRTGLAPDEVFVLLSGKMRTLGEMPGTEGPVWLAEHGPGACIGWDAALADVGTTQTIAHGVASGIVIAAEDFIRIARQDAELRKTVFAQPTLGEIWRAVVSELRRREVGVECAAGLVKALTPLFVARDWPGMRGEIEAKRSFTWVVAGGTGVTAGSAWQPHDDVQWARLIGVPTDKFESVIKRSVDGESARKVASISVESEETDATPTGKPSARANGGRFFRTGIALLGLCAGAVIGVTGWASRQPVVERVESGGRLFFAGEARDLKASVSGRLSELRISAGQKVAEGAVLAVVVPPRDEAKWKQLAATLAEAKRDGDFCERLLAGQPVKAAEAPSAIAQAVRNIEALRGELRVKRAIASGAKDDPSLTPDEKAQVNAHFAALNADRSARIDSAQNDSSVKREDLAEAEQALREAQAELRLQISSAAELRVERGEEAKLSAAAAARAIASYKRMVSQRQDTVNRIRKEISSIRVAPASTPMPASAPAVTAGLEAAIREAEKDIRAHSASMRALAAETEIALERLNLDAAPRQIVAARAGILDSVAALPKDSEIKEATVLGRFVTRSAWEIELPDAMLSFLKPGRQFVMFKTARDGSEVRVDAYFTGMAEGAGANRARFTTTASEDNWRQGDVFRVKTDAVVGSLLDRWLVDPASILR